MLTLAIGIGAGMAFYMGLGFAMANACAAEEKPLDALEVEWEAEELRWEEEDAKHYELANRWKALCKERDRLLTKAEDYSDRAYAENSERWSELANSYLEQAEVCENAMKIIEKMQNEIDLEYTK